MTRSEDAAIGWCVILFFIYTLSGGSCHQQSGETQSRKQNHFFTGSAMAKRGIAVDKRVDDDETGGDNIFFQKNGSNLIFRYRGDGKLVESEEGE